MKEQTYEQFLENKLKNEHTYAHFLEADMQSFKEKNVKLLRDLAASRRTENDLKLRMKQMEEKMFEQQIQIKRLKDFRTQKTKESADKRIREEKQKTSVMDSKQIFRMYLDNTFPKYKGLLKKILKILYILEDTQSKQPEQKIKIYKTIFESGVKRLLDWLFPKKVIPNNKKQIAQNIVSQWKEKEKQEKGSIQKTNILFLKEASYVQQIEKLEAQMLELNSSKKLLEGRMKTYERSTQVKGSEFVAHLKKMLRDTPDLQPEAYSKVDQIIKIFTDVIHLSGGKKIQEDQQKAEVKQSPLARIDTPVLGQYKKKAPPILKKNVFGYFIDPQFDGNYTLPNPTKHVNCNKAVQTLSEDLCILTLHPVIMVTLIDANIKPQRTRHSSKYYVRIRVNQDNQIDSTVKEGLQIVWNQPFLLKDYDFPFIKVLLMHQSKGLRDYSLGGGKFSVNCQQQKIVNIRKEKEFIGRVRFSLSYPKGNIYQFKIISVLIEIPQNKNVLKEQVNILFPYNALLTFEFNLPEKIIYTDKSVIILENCFQNMIVDLPKEDLSQKISLEEFTAKEGNKEVAVTLEKDWRVIIQGEIYLLICEDSEPQRIDQQLLQGGKGKYFSVRAPPPIITVTYHKTTLHSNIKFPLVFNLDQSQNSLSIIKELQNRELNEERIDMIVNPEGYLKLSDFIKAPNKIYKFFIETLEGEKVYLKHESHLFQRLLKQIFLQVSYKEDEIQEINYARKGRVQKQKLYKEFAIQTSQLMINHYKIFTKNFKKIGFIKFKLGYTIYDNQLKIQTTKKYQEESKLIQYKNIEGLVFIYLQLSTAHLKNQSSGSSYSCKLNECSETKQIKGNHPKWKEGFTFSIQVKGKLQLQLNYSIIEYTTLRKNVIYSGKISIDQNVLELGTLIIPLDDKGQDCLHFENIKVPSSIFNLCIQSISAQIQEEADWIGKIDPYCSLQSCNRELLKTEYLDNIGSHPVWENINQQYFISSHEDKQIQNEDFLSLKISDYDLIGKDDYIGEVIIGTKLNPELLSSGESQMLHGNIVKENQICGSVKIRGTFKKTLQAKYEPRPKPIEKLSKKDIVYKIVLFQITLNNYMDHENSKGILIVKNGEEILKNYQFFFENKQTTALNSVIWNTQFQSYTFMLQKEEKGFFKTSIEKIGKFNLEVSEKQFYFSQTQIVDEQGKVVGWCKYFIEFQHQVKYSVMTHFTCCKSNVKVKSDLDDSINIPFLKQQLQIPLIIFYQEKLFVQTLNFQKKENIIQDLKLHKKNIYKVSISSDQHEDETCFLKIYQNLLYQTRLQEKSQRNELKHDRRFKKIKYLHWQPYKYRQTQEYQLVLKTKDNQSFQLNQKLQSVYNNYLVLSQNAVPIIFDSDNLPVSLIIKNLTNQEQDIISLKDENINKIFIPNRGALYFHLQQYNHQSILELSFQYIFIKVTNLTTFNKYKDIKVHLSTSHSIKTFSCSSLPFGDCFAFQNLNMWIADPAVSDFFFFTGHFSGVTLEGNKRQEILPCKFGFKLQNNKKQYKFIQSQNMIVHTQFSCCFIERHYEVNPPIDNTIYGMHFIELKHIQFQINQDPPEKGVSIILQLNNQHQTIKFARKGQSNVFQTDVESTFFIEKLNEIQFSIIQQGYFKKNVIGSGYITISQLNIVKETVELQIEIKKNNTNIGRVKLVYKNKGQLEFIDVNMFSYISKNNNVVMKAELHQIGPYKDKYQSIILTSKGNVPRLESEDSFIIIGDPRNYQVNVSQKNSDKLLGQFKLCHELTKIGDTISVFQPLRTSSDSLNSALIIDYEQKQSNTLAFEKMKGIQVHLIELVISHFTFSQHHSRLKDQFSINLKTHSRNITTKPAQIQLPSQQKRFVFTLYDNQNCEFTFLEKFNKPIGRTSVSAPYSNGQERILVFTHQKQAIGVCRLDIRFILNQEEISKKREIVSMQAIDLLDTEYFVKMTPYVEIDTYNQERWPCYISELGLGRENIYWKLGLITEHPINFIIKDKDMFFDDLIGNAVLPPNQSEQTEQITHDITLISSEGENRERGNGQFKIITRPIMKVQQGANQIFIMKQKHFSKYLLRVNGLSSRTKKDLDETKVMEISLGSGLSKHIIYRRKFNRDFLSSIFNKQIEVEFDTAFSNNSHPSLLTISLDVQQNPLMQQIITLNQTQKMNSQQIFQIIQLIPQKQSVYSLTKIYFWLFKKNDQNISLHLINSNKLSKMNKLLQEQQLIIAEPYQVIDLFKKETIIMATIEDKKIFRVVLSKINVQQKEKKLIIIQPIVSLQGKELGLLYAEFNLLISEGSDEVKNIFIGKSIKKWIFLTIVEAALTKDLQIFSKMDPYCKFTLIQEGKNQQWKETKVLQDIGMNPVWRQSFFIPIDEKQIENCTLKLVVMDSQVTWDREIGLNSIPLSKLITSTEQKNEIDLIYKKQQQSGKLFINSKVINQYIIFRNIVLTELSRKDQQVYLFHQTNSQTDKGTIIEEGLTYPFNENLPITIRYGENSKTFTFMELKQRANEDIVFEEDLISLSYQLYD